MDLCLSYSHYQNGSNLFRTFARMLCYTHPSSSLHIQLVTFVSNPNTPILLCNIFGLILHFLPIIAHFRPFLPYSPHFCPSLPTLARLVETRGDRLPRAEVRLQWTNHGTTSHKITHHSLPVVAIYDDVYWVFVICERNSRRTCANRLAVRRRFFLILFLGFRVVSPWDFVQILVWNSMGENLSFT